MTTIEKQIVQACLNDSVAEAIMLLRHFGIDPNEARFGCCNPLLVELAFRRKIDCFKMLREEVGADPEVVDNGGRTALSFVLFNHLYRDRGDPSALPQLMEVVGAKLTQDTLQGIAILAFGECKSTDDLQPFVAAGIDFMRNYRLMHLFSVWGCHLSFARDMLDRFPAQQSPFERAADGLTLFDRPEVQPELIEMLHDAIEEPQPRDLAVMMALHRRVGGDSPMCCLDEELLRSHILPHAMRRRNVNETRTRRIEALIESEGLFLIPADLKQLYIDGERMFVPMLFRRAHFLAVCKTPGCVLEAEDGIFIQQRLETRGIVFDVPYSLAYEARALAMAQHAFYGEFGL